jgi:hypothetical protein
MNRKYLTRKTKKYYRKSRISRQSRLKDIHRHNKSIKHDKYNSRKSMKSRKSSISSIGGGILGNMIKVLEPKIFSMQKQPLDQSPVSSFMKALNPSKYTEVFNSTKPFANIIYNHRIPNAIDIVTRPITHSISINDIQSEPHIFTAMALRYLLILFNPGTQDLFWAIECDMHVKRSSIFNYTVPENIPAATQFVFQIYSYPSSSNYKRVTIGGNDLIENRKIEYTNIMKFINTPANNIKLFKEYRIAVSINTNRSQNAFHAILNRSTIPSSDSQQSSLYKLARQ